MTNQINPAATFRYWLDVGRTNGQFTLHRRLMSRPEHPMVREYTYIRNLGRVFEEACERADRYIAELHTDDYPFAAVKDYDVSEGWSDCRHAGRYDDEQLWFGKYAGSDIDDVAANDPEYLRYIRDNFDRIRPRMKSLLEKIDAMNLGESDRVRAAREREEQRAAEQAAYEAIKQPIPTELAEGRSRFTGHIIAVYDRDSYYGMTTKMIFEDERGFRLNGTVPNALFDDGTDAGRTYDDLRGARIEFDAALNIADDDESFGFFKRPTKAVVTTEAGE